MWGEQRRGGEAHQTSKLMQTGEHKDGVKEKLTRFLFDLTEHAE